MQPTIAGRFRGRPVAVLYGGETSERAVSLRTGEAVATALESRGYEVARFDWAAHRIQALADAGFAAIFIALHGGAGENGELQGVLDILGLPYTASGVLASALAMDKDRTKLLARAVGVPTAPWVTWSRAQAEGWLAAVREGAGAKAADWPMALPCVVKPTSDGSSVGISIVREEHERVPAVEAALAAHGDVLIERFVQGAEVTVALVDGVALGTCEVRPAQGWYDYASKYERGDTIYVVPSTLPPDADAQVQRHAAAMYRVLGCRGVARIDFLVERAGEACSPWLLEANTVPGMTATSLVPKIAAGEEIDFPTLCEWLLDLARTDGAAASSAR